MFSIFCANNSPRITCSVKFFEPIVITGKRGNAVLLAEGDWNAINETLYLISIPGMRESIIEAMKEPLKGTSTELEW